MKKWINTIDYPLDIVISAQTIKKEIHCTSVSLTKRRLRAILLTLTVCENNGIWISAKDPSLQCVLFCAGRQSVNLMKRVIFLWLSVTK